MVHLLQLVSRSWCTNGKQNELRFCQVVRLWYSSSKTNCRRLSDLLRLTMQCFNTVLTKLSKLLKFSQLQPKKRKEEEHQKLRYFKSFVTFRKMTQVFFFSFLNVRLKISKPVLTCLLNDAFCGFSALLILFPGCCQPCSVSFYFQNWDMWGFFNFPRKHADVRITP